MRNFMLVFAVAFLILAVVTLARGDYIYAGVEVIVGLLFMILVSRDNKNKSI